MDTTPFYDIWAVEGHKYLGHVARSVLRDQFNINREALERVDRYAPGEGVVVFGNGRRPDYIVCKAQFGVISALDVIKE